MSTTLKTSTDVEFGQGNMDEGHGGSPFGASTIEGRDLCVFSSSDLERMFSNFYFLENVFQLSNHYFEVFSEKTNSLRALRKFANPGNFSPNVLKLGQQLQNMSEISKLKLQTCENV